MEDKTIITEKSKLTIKPSKAKVQRDALKPTVPPDQLVVDKELMARLHQEHRNTLNLFLEVFDTEHGQKLLEHLDKYAHKNFPNYDNNNATFSKIGEQTLVDYMRAMIAKAKKGVL